MVLGLARQTCEALPCLALNTHTGVGSQTERQFSVYLVTKIVAFNYLPSGSYLKSNSHIGVYIFMYVFVFNLFNSKMLS